MRYWECVLDTPSEEIDARCDELAGLGVGGFVVENEEDFRNFLENNHQYWDYVDQELEDRFAGISRLKFYVTDDADGQAVLQQVRTRYPDVAVSTVEDSDWENNWREYYKPIEVGERLVVVPEWEEIPAGGRLPLRLDPGLIFGTGSHATTRMCLQALEDYAEEADAAGVEMDDFFFSAPYPNGNFSVGKEGITWYFNPYDIAPYALGVIDVTLSWDQLKPLLK